MRGEPCLCGGDDCTACRGPDAARLSAIDDRATERAEDILDALTAAAKGNQAISQFVTRGGSDLLVMIDRVAYEWATAEWEERQEAGRG